MTPAAGRDGTTKAIPAEAGYSVAYHCVCGATAELDVRSGGRCQSCGRRYSAEVARVACSETIRMPGTFGEPAHAGPQTAPVDGAVRAVRLSIEAAVVAAAEPRGDVGLPADRQLEHFRVVGRLGRGGMGDVYRALDESLQRYVALKVLRPGLDGPAAGSAGLPHLLQEARAQARVNHPGVVHIYYVSPDPERPFLAMELVPGPTLAKRLEGGPLPYAQTIDVALQIVRALRHAARYDVVHGDIKPSNILLAGDGSVKLSDFGLARRLSGRGAGSSGPISGTPHYLPPEVLAGAEPDVRSDMYALGVTLFEMTFGRRPYTVPSGKLLDQIEAHRSAPPEFPEAWPTDLPSGWRTVLARLLEKEPSRRYQTHDELLAALDRVRPVDLPKAGPFNRALSWGADLFLAWAAEILLLTPAVIFAVQGIALTTSALPVLLPAVGCLILSATAWLQAAWKTSPGQTLLQLRIVDRNGLTPNGTILAARAVLQLLPAWGVVVANVLSLGFRAGFAGLLVMGAVLIATFADAGVALVRRDGRSLYDLLLGTRVVLDTRTGDEAT